MTGELATERRVHPEASIAGGYQELGCAIRTGDEFLRTSRGHVEQGRVELNRLEIDQRTVERGGDPTTRRVTASGDGRMRIMVDDPEVVALAVTAARSFAEVPVCGVDVVREVGSGRLCILEMNTWGYVWHLSSPSGRETQKRLGLDRYGQYGALDVAAQAIAAATRDLLG